MRELQRSRKFINLLKSHQQRNQSKHDPTKINKTSDPQECMKRKNIRESKQQSIQVAFDADWMTSPCFIYNLTWPWAACDKHKVSKKGHLRLWKVWLPARVIYSFDLSLQIIFHVDSTDLMLWLSYRRYFGKQKHSTKQVCKIRCVYISWLSSKVTKRITCDSCHVQILKYRIAVFSLYHICFH